MACLTCKSRRSLYGKEKGRGGQQQAAGEMGVERGENGWRKSSRPPFQRAKARAVKNAGTQIDARKVHGAWIWFSNISARMSARP